MSEIVPKGVSSRSGTAPPSGKGKKKPRAGQAMTQLERDMKFVLKEKSKGKDWTPQQERLFDEMKVDFGKFLDRLTKLETARRVKFKPVEHPDAVGGNSSSVVDVGQEAAERMIARLIDEYQEKEAQRS